MERLREVGETGCWDESDPKEQDKLMHQYAVIWKKPAHFGRIFEILVEKNSHLPKGDEARKYKGRVVYQGNNVIDENRKRAVFEELSSCPATMAASKASDFTACLPGNHGQQSDAETAYTQAPFKGTDTWILVPRHQWPKPDNKNYDKWFWPDGSPRFQKPCCKMLRV